MFTYVLLSIYILAILFLTGFLVIFSMHIKGYLPYSKYIKGVFRLYLLSILIIAIFGGYKIFTGDNPSLSSPSSTTERQLNF